MTVGFCGRSVGEDELALDLFRPDETKVGEQFGFQPRHKKHHGQGQACTDQGGYRILGIAFEQARNLTEREDHVNGVSLSGIFIEAPGKQQRNTGGDQREYQGKSDTDVQPHEKTGERAEQCLNTGQDDQNRDLARMLPAQLGVNPRTYPVSQNPILDSSTGKRLEGFIFRASCIEHLIQLPFDFLLVQRIHP